MTTKKEITETKEATLIIELRHKLKMEELNYIRETERLKHSWELERQRIKTAEIRKNHERKANREFIERNRG